MLTFTTELLHEHLIGMRAFEDVSLEAAESAIKRAVNVTHAVERVPSKPGYVRPVGSPGVAKGSPVPSRGTKPAEEHQ